VLDPLGAHPRAIRAARFLARLSSIGVPGLLNDECFTGACFRGTMDALMAPLPMDVPVLTVYSRCDSVVPWHLCLDPCAECFEVRSTHTGVGFDPDFYTALEPRLGNGQPRTTSVGGLLPQRRNAVSRHVLVGGPTA
jgi:hypothetical protein